MNSWWTADNCQEQKKNRVVFLWIFLTPQQKNHTPSGATECFHFHIPTSWINVCPEEKAHKGK